LAGKIHGLKIKKLIYLFLDAFWAILHNKSIWSPCQPMSSFTLEQGCQIFLGPTYQKPEKINQMATRYTYEMRAQYTKWPQNVPNGHKIY
jgi:hypothetical protein